MQSDVRNLGVDHNSTPNARPTRTTGSLSLGFEEALDLVLCGVLVAGLMFLAQRFQLDLPSMTFYAGLAGAALCVAWGTLGLRAKAGRPGAIATLIAVAGVLARQAFLSWGASGGGEAKVRIVAFLMTTMAVLCAGTCVNLIRGAGPATWKRRRAAENRSSHV